MKIPVQYIGTVKTDLPQYHTVGSSGMDLHAAIIGPVVLMSLERHLFKTE